LIALVPDNDVYLLPKDILVPSAALLGFIIAALTFVSTTLGQSTTPESREQLAIILRNFTAGFLAVVVLTTLAVTAAAFSSIIRNAKLARLSIAVFGIGWALVGTIVSLILAGSVFGIESLQIQLPQFDPTSLFLVSVFLTIVEFLSARFLAKTVAKRVVKLALRTRREIRRRYGRGRRKNT